MVLSSASGDAGASATEWQRIMASEKETILVNIDGRDFELSLYFT